MADYEDRPLTSRPFSFQSSDVDSLYSTLVSARYLYGDNAFFYVCDGRYWISTYQTDRSQHSKRMFEPTQRFLYRRTALKRARTFRPLISGGSPTNPNLEEIGVV